MPRMYDVSERNLFGMKTDILEKEGTWLAEIGLLVVLLHNKGKDMKDSVRSHLKSLQLNPSKIGSFFHAPYTKYAA